MRTKRISILLLLFAFIVSCNPNEIVLKSDHCFPAEPVNLKFINSKYDDYNSDSAPGEYDMYSIIFSSNRNSNGKNYDFNIFTINMSYPFDKDVVSISESAGITSMHSYMNEIIDDINTADNQFGPYIYNFQESSDYLQEEFIFFYAQGDKDDLDIKFWVHDLVDKPTIHNRYNWSGPFEFKAINTDKYSEGYLSIHDDKVYFCSNRNGDYDIFELEIPIDKSILEFIKSENNNSFKPVNELNSVADDKCPFVEDNFIVFASNREGGFGGYDIWYSVKEDGVWSKPLNFGSKINSEYDEYRPIFRKYVDIENDMMIFSSNRPGGSGGFDLYYVGIDKIR